MKLENNEEFYEDSVDVGIGIMPVVDGIWIDKEYFDYIEKNEIVNHSKNIIDLIQVGDYVNGCKVLYKVANMYLMVSTSDFSNNKIFNYMIKSILTKEMYEQNVFKVVE